MDLDVGPDCWIDYQPGARRTLYRVATAAAGRDAISPVSYTRPAGG
jgi:hypothetical protein